MSRVPAEGNSAGPECGLQAAGPTDANAARDFLSSIRPDSPGFSGHVRLVSPGFPRILAPFHFMKSNMKTALSLLQGFVFGLAILPVATVAQNNGKETNAMNN